MINTFERMIKRVGELADYKMRDLRSEWPYSGADSRTANIEATKGMSRGAIIQDILLDEFVEDDFHNEGCYAERR